MTAHEIEHLWTEHYRNDQELEVTPEIIDRFNVRLQQTHEDYHPVDIESVQWLTGQISTDQLLSMSLVCSQEALILYNETIGHLREIQAFFKYGTRIHNQRRSARISLFHKMDWTANYSVSHSIYNRWAKVHDFLVEIQSDIPMEAYLMSKGPLDQWFESMHLYWDSLLNEVRNHMFSRTFRDKEEHTPFQQSIHWAFFFHMFWTDYEHDTLQVIAIKHRVWFQQEFQTLLKGFISIVEHSLDEISVLDRDPVDLTVDEMLNDLAVGVTFFLSKLDTTKWHEKWLSTQLWRAYSQWAFALSRGGESVVHPKANLAAKVIWNMEAIVAVFEPLLFGDADAHEVLMTLRDNVQRYTFHVVLNNSWI